MTLGRSLSVGPPLVLVCRGDGPSGGGGGGSPAL